MAAMHAQPSVQEILPRVLQDLKTLTTQDGFQQLTNYVNELARLQAKVQDQDTAIDLLTGKMKDRLDEMEGDKQKLKTLNDNLADTQKNLAIFKSRLLAEKYFGGACNEQLLGQPKIWEQLQDNPLLTKVPIPVSNSGPARRIRTIIAITIISNAFVTHIFLKFGFDKSMRKLMLKLAIAKPDDEAHCRSSLLGILRYLPGYGKEDIIRSTTQAVESVTSTLGPLLVSSEYDEFRQSVSKLCEEATEAWNLIQHAQPYYEALMDLDYEKWELIDGDRGFSHKAQQLREW
ncbi:unnamed protein product [Parascedosporium putredinis]|uniref:Uncharacterized protein n=1 Tax=Parascedosporium putredinis TaxID=1442378 RepID=A0A9P1M920_9PEZI|nr:unnamed protein product [Parascedosporium putredinis]CAI7993799.1 unnamed protein product [Parascedosporium putredinis]